MFVLKLLTILSIIIGSIDAEADEKGLFSSAKEQNTTSDDTNGKNNATNESIDDFEKELQQQCPCCYGTKEEKAKRGCPNGNNSKQQSTGGANNGGFNNPINNPTVNDGMAVADGIVKQITSLLHTLTGLFGVAG